MLPAQVLFSHLWLGSCHLLAYIIWSSLAPSRLIRERCIRGLIDGTVAAAMLHPGL